MRVERRAEQIVEALSIQSPELAIAGRCRRRWLPGNGGKGGGA
jgi:hypothetical protein